MQTLIFPPSPKEYRQRRAEIVEIGKTFSISKFDLIPEVKYTCILPHSFLYLLPLTLLPVSARAFHVGDSLQSLLFSSSFMSFLPSHWSLRRDSNRSTTNSRVGHINLRFLFWKNFADILKTISLNCKTCPLSLSLSLTHTLSLSLSPLFLIFLNCQKLISSFYFLNIWSFLVASISLCSLFSLRCLTPFDQFGVFDAVHWMASQARHRIALTPWLPQR